METMNGLLEQRISEWRTYLLRRQAIHPGVRGLDLDRRRGLPDALLLQVAPDKRRGMHPSPDSKP